MIKLLRHHKSSKYSLTQGKFRQTAQLFLGNYPMHWLKILFTLMFFLIPSLACSSSLRGEKPTPSPLLSPINPASTTIVSQSTKTNSIPPTTAFPLKPTNEGQSFPDEELSVINAESYTSLWAMQAFSDSSKTDPYFASGKPDVLNCTEPMLPIWAPDNSDKPQFLTLNFSTPLLANQLNIHSIGDPGEIIRVEVFNSFSGLGEVIHDVSYNQLSPKNLEQCPAILSVPVNVDFEVDVVIITISASQQPLQIDAVQLEGDLLGFQNFPVFWRVPLPNTPISLAANKNGLIYAVTEPDGLFSFDVEGNQLNEFPTPDFTKLSDVTVDSSGNLLIIDNSLGWFILISPEGDHLLISGDDLYGEAAINPLDNNLYILMENIIKIFSTVSGEFLFEIDLELDFVYSSLLFDTQGRLFLLRNPQWQADLVQIDPLTGLELDATPLIRANLYPIEIVARDLAIDNNGNFYILFSNNTGQIAVHVLDTNANFKERFGQLTTDMGDWQEGYFLDPRAITVSPDGRFIIVADGFEEQSYLTAFIREIEEE